MPVILASLLPVMHANASIAYVVPGILELRVLTLPNVFASFTNILEVAG